MDFRNEEGERWQLSRMTLEKLLEWCTGEFAKIYNLAVKLTSFMNDKELLKQGVVQGLNQEQIGRAFGDASTQLPDYVHAPQAWIGRLGTGNLHAITCGLIFMKNQ